MLLQEGLKFGTVPDWIAGFGTAAATIIAVVVLNREVQARREAKAAELYQQARRVLCWLDVDKKYGEEITAVINNGSDEPIFDCRAHIQVPDDAVDLISNLTLPDDIVRTGIRRLTFREPMLPPGEYRKQLPLPSSIRRRSSAWLFFTDAAGQPWHRSTSGQLIRKEHRQLLRQENRSEPDTSSAITPRVGCAVLWHGPASTAHEVTWAE